MIVSSALPAQDTASTHVSAKRVTSETRVRVQIGERNGTLDIRADSFARRLVAATSSVSARRPAPRAAIAMAVLG